MIKQQHKQKRFLTYVVHLKKRNALLAKKAPGPNFIFIYSVYIWKTNKHNQLNTVEKISLSSLFIIYLMMISLRQSIPKISSSLKFCLEQTYFRLQLKQIAPP